MRMNLDDSRLIATFQRLFTEILIEKRLGQRRPELADELLLGADRHALWLAGLVRLSNPDAASPLASKETEPLATVSVSPEAA
jgi:hypothetical protein